LAPLAACALSATLGCSSSAGVAAPSDSGAAPDGTTADAPSTVTLRVDPPDVALTLPLGGTAPTGSYRVLEKASPEAAEVDVTADAVVSILDDATIATIAGGTISMVAHGGTTGYSVTSHGATATATLHVKLVGDVFAAGFDPTKKAAFDAATIDPTGASQPKIEYPLDGAVVPQNLPPMEAQWSAGGDSTAYRVRLSAPSVDVAFYTTARESTASVDTWKLVLASAAGGKLAHVVEGLGATGLHVSAKASLSVARDRIDDSAVFFWESSSGSMKVLDIGSGKLSALPVTGSAYAPGSATTCVACHTVSRDGTRFAYTSGSFGLGTLKASDDKTTFTAKIEPGTKVTPGFKWTYGAFNPDEVAAPPALLVTKADTNAQNAPGHVRLAFVDPETGAEIASNADTWLAAFPAGIGRDLLQPDWSSSGVVVFTAYDSEKANPDATQVLKKGYVRDLGDDAIASSIVEASVAWDATAKRFVLGAPKVIVSAPLAPYDAAETDVLPQLSPDDKFVAFTRSDGWWPIRLQSDAVNGTGRLALVRRSDGTVLELTTASGPPNSNSTWPQWAPTVGKDYAWVAFSSERPYGHRMAKGVALPAACIPQGRALCKNMWITAIDLKSAVTGTADPSQVPFWIPGQIALASAVSPRWTKSALSTIK
jgi:hypothetical protein